MENDSVLLTKMKMPSKKIPKIFYHHQMERYTDHYDNNINFSAIYKLNNTLT